MADKIQLDLEVDFSNPQSLASAKSMLDGMAESVETISAATKGQNIFGDDPGSTLFTDRLEYIRGAVVELSTTLDKMQEQMGPDGVFGGVSSGFFEKTGQYIASNITQLRTFQREIQSLEKTVGSKKLTNAAKLERIRDSSIGDITQEAVYSALDIRQRNAVLNSMLRDNGFASQNLGWDASRFSATAQSIYNQMIHQQLAQMPRGSMKQAIATLTQDKHLQNVLNRMSGTALSGAQLQNNIRLMLQAFAPSSMFNDDRQEYRTLMGKLIPGRASFQFSVLDQMPKIFSDAFQGMGRGIDTSKIQKVRESKRKISTMELQKMVEETEDGLALEKIFEQAGIMKKWNGRRVWLDDISLSQASYLGGLSAQAMRRAKGGVMPYTTSVFDPSSQRRVLGRNNAVIRANAGLQTYLAGIEDIYPSTDYNPKNFTPIVAPRKGVDKSKVTAHYGASIRESVYPSAFYIPNVGVDFSTGQLQFSDPSWRKSGHPKENIEEDKFVTITDSVLTRLIAQADQRIEARNAAEGKASRGVWGTGAGTFGFGYDEHGAPKYMAPRILSVPITSFYERDKEGYFSGMSESKLPLLQKIVGGQSFKYGRPGEERTYSYGLQGQDQVFMLDTEVIEEINKMFEEQHLPSPLAGWNEKGLNSPGRQDKIVKQINAMKKLMSTGQPYEEVYGTWSDRQKHNMRGALIRLDSLYSALNTALELGPLDHRRYAKSMTARALLDGIAIGSPEYFRNGAFHGRAGAGAAKFVLSPFNWQELMRMSLKDFNLTEADFSSDTGAFIRNGSENWMLTRDKGEHGQYHIYAPSMSATDEMVLQLRQGTRSGLTQKQLQDLRSQYFVDIMDPSLAYLMDESAIKSDDKFAVLSQRHYIDSYGARGKEKLEEARRQGRIRKDGLVTLTWQEQDAAFRRANQIGGFGGWLAMHTAADFDSKSGLMSEQEARAFGLSEEDIQKGRIAFQNRIDELGTTGGRIRALQRNPAYAQRIKQDESFIWSSTADAYIGAQQRALRDRQMMNYIATPEDFETGLAVPTPGAIAELFMEAFGLDVSKMQGAIREIFPHFMDPGENAPASATRRYFSFGSKAAGGVATRSPAGPAMNANVVNILSEEARKRKMVGGETASISEMKEVLNRIGITEENAGLYFTPSTMYRLNTGDFDGDTVRLFASLSEKTVKNTSALQDEILKINAEQEEEEIRRRQIQEKLTQAGSETDRQDLQSQLSTSDLKISALERRQRGISAMGTASAIIRDAIALSDDDPQKYKKMAEGILAYDKATSEVQVKGEDFVISDVARETLSAGQLYERFIKKIIQQRDEGDVGSNYTPNLLKANLPHISDPMGMPASAMRAVTARTDPQFLPRLQELTNSWLYSNYTQDSPEREFIKWYLGIYTRGLTGIAASREDIGTGQNLLSRWKTVFQQAKGTRTSSAFDEMKSNIFRAERAIEDLQGENGFNEEALEAEADRLLVDAEADPDAALRLKMIRIIQERTRQSRSTDQNIISQELDEKKKETSAEAEQLSKTISERREAMQSVPLSEQRAKKLNYRWSNIKYWIPGGRFDISKLGDAKVTKFDGTQMDGLGAFSVADYTGHSDWQRDAIAKMLGYQGYSSHILAEVGNVMHSAFEAYYNGLIENPDAPPARKFSDILRDMLIHGGNNYVDTLKTQFGLQVSQGENGEISLSWDDKHGEQRRAGGGTKAPEAALARLNALLGVGDFSSTGSIGDQITDYLQRTYLANGYTVVGTEKKLKGPDGTLYKTGEDISMQIPTGQKETLADGTQVDKMMTVSLHGQPDLVMRDKQGYLHIFDYKSAAAGAAESIPQSIYYGELLSKGAKEYYELHAKSDEGKHTDKLTADEQTRYSFLAANGFNLYGRMNNGQFESLVRSVNGIDPFDARGILSVQRPGKRQDDGRDVWEDVYEKVIAGATAMYRDATELGPGSKFLDFLAEQQSLQQKIRDKERRVFGEEGSEVTARTFDPNTVEGKMHQYYLAKYATDTQTLNDLNSAVYRDSDRMHIPYGSRYTRWLEEAGTLMSDDTLRSVIEEYGERSPQADEIRKQIDDREKLIERIRAQEEDAVTGDWQSFARRTMPLLQRTEDSELAQSITGIMKSAISARSVMEGLKTREYTDANPKEGEKAQIPYWDKSTGEWNFAAAQRLAERENGRDVGFQKELEQTQKLYQEGEQAQAEAFSAIFPALDKRIAADTQAQTSAWNKITGKPMDATAKVQEFMTAQVESIVHMIDQWNNEVSSIDKMIKDTEGLGTSEEVQQLRDRLQQLRTDRQNRATQARNYLTSVEAEEKAIKDMRQSLGLDPQKSTLDSVREWGATRLAAISKTEEVDRKKPETYRQMREDYINNRINTLNEIVGVERARGRWELFAGDPSFKPSQKKKILGLRDMYMAATPEDKAAYEAAMAVEESQRSDEQKAAIENYKPVLEYEAMLERARERMRQRMPLTQVDTSPRTDEREMVKRQQAAMEAAAARMATQEPRILQARMAALNGQAISYEDRRAMAVFDRDSDFLKRMMDPKTSQEEKEALMKMVLGDEYGRMYDLRHGISQESLDARQAAQNYSFDTRFAGQTRQDYGRMRQHGMYGMQYTMIGRAIMERNSMHDYYRGRVEQDQQGILASKATEAELRAKMNAPGITTEDQKRYLKQIELEQQRQKAMQERMGRNQATMSRFRIAGSMTREERKAARDNYRAVKRDYDSEKDKLQTMKTTPGFGLMQIKEQQDKVNGLSNSLKAAESEVSTFGSTASAAFSGVGMSVNRLVMSLGRRFLMKALREAVQFIRQFDEQMTSIQTITLKSDAEMKNIRQQTVDKAIGMRTSVANVASVEGELYRQGLSDAEVSTRTDAILKFAKVSGAKVTDATKIITSALQNGLVASAEEAMDALVALGDSAATTAEQIGKAMQKCAASAKVAGVSYGELTSMITIMTSTTQLSGTQVGTALNTILSRMRQITTTNYAKDINGEATGINEIEKALSSAGISLREPGDSSSIRAGTSILLDIAKRWNTMTDVQKANINTAMAGTRAANMFQTLMEGMSEDDGAEFERLLGLSEDSKGITETKYEVAMKSLNSSIEQLKATWDSFVESLVSDGVATGFVDAITHIVAGLKEINGLVAVGAPLIVGMVASIASIIVGGPIGAALSGIFGLAAGGLTAWGLSAWGNAKNSKTTEQKEYEQQQKDTTAFSEQQSAYLTKMTDAYNNAEEAIAKYNKAKESGADESTLQAAGTAVVDSFNKMGSVIPGVTGQITDANDALSQWADTADKAKAAINKFKNTSGQIILGQQHAMMPQLVSNTETSLSAAGKANYDQNGFKEAFNIQDDRVFEEMDSVFNEYGKVYKDALRSYVVEAAVRARETGGTKGDDNSFIRNSGLKLTNVLDLFINSGLLQAKGFNLSDFESGAKLLTGLSSRGYDGKDYFFRTKQNYNRRELFWSTFSNWLQDLVTEGRSQDFTIDYLQSGAAEIVDTLFGQYAATQGEENVEIAKSAFQNRLNKRIKDRINNGGSLSLLDVGNMYFDEIGRYKPNNAAYYADADNSYLMYSGLSLDTSSEYRGRPDTRKTNVLPKEAKFVTRDEALESTIGFLKVKGNYGGKDISSMSDEEVREYAKTLVKTADGQDAYRVASSIVNDAFLNYQTNNKNYTADLIGLQQKLAGIEDFKKVDEVLGREYPNLEGMLNKNQSLLIAWADLAKASENEEYESIFTMDDFNALLQDAITGKAGGKHNIYNRWLQGIFGERWGAAFATADKNQANSIGEVARTNISNLRESDGGRLQLQMLSEAYGLSDLMTKIENGEEITPEDLQQVWRAFEQEGITAFEQFGERSADVASAFEAITSSAKSAAGVLRDFASQGSKLKSNQDALRRFQAGDYSNDVISAIESMTGMSTRDIMIDALYHNGSNVVANMQRQMDTEIANYETQVMGAAASAGKPVGQYAIVDGSGAIIQVTNNRRQAEAAIEDITSRGGDLKLEDISEPSTLSSQDFLDKYGSQLSKDARSLIGSANGTFRWENGAWQFDAADIGTWVPDQLKAVSRVTYTANNRTYADLWAEIAQGKEPKERKATEKRPLTDDDIAYNDRLKTFWEANGDYAAMQEAFTGNRQYLQHYAADMAAGTNTMKIDDYTSLLGNIFSVGENGLSFDNAARQNLLDNISGDGGALWRNVYGSAAGMIDGLGEMLAELLQDGTVSKTVQERVRKSIEQQERQQQMIDQYGQESGTNIANMMNQLAGSANEAASAMSNLISSLTGFAKFAKALANMNSNNYNSDDVSTIAETMGMKAPEFFANGGLNNPVIAAMVEAQRKSYAESAKEMLTGLVNNNPTDESVIALQNAGVLSFTPVKRTSAKPVLTNNTVSTATLDNEGTGLYDVTVNENALSDYLSATGEDLMRGVATTWRLENNTYGSLLNNIATNGRRLDIDSSYDDLFRDHTELAALMTSVNRDTDAFMKKYAKGLLNGKSILSAEDFNNVLELFDENGNFDARRLEQIQTGTGNEAKLLQWILSLARSEISELDAVVNEQVEHGSVSDQTLKAYRNADRISSLKETSAFGDSTENVVNIMTQLSGSMDQAAGAVGNFLSATQQMAAGLQTIYNFRGSNSSATTMKQVAEMTGFDLGWLYSGNNADNPLVKYRLQQVRQQRMQAVNDTYLAAANQIPYLTKPGTYSISNIRGGEGYTSLDENIQSIFNNGEGTVTVAIGKDGKPYVSSVALDEGSIEKIFGYNSGESAVAQYEAENKSYANQWRAFANMPKGGLPDFIMNAAPFSEFIAANQAFGSMYNAAQSNPELIGMDYIRAYAMAQLTGDNRGVAAANRSLMGRAFTFGENGMITGGNLGDLRKLKEVDLIWQSLTSQFPKLAEAFSQLETAGEIDTTTLKELNDAFSDDAVSAMTQYGAELQNIQSILQQISGSASDVAGAFKNAAAALSEFVSFANTMKDFKNGSNESSVLNTIAQTTQIPVEWLYANRENPEVQRMIQQQYNANEAAATVQISAAEAALSNAYGQMMPEVMFRKTGINAHTPTKLDMDQINALRENLAGNDDALGMLDILAAYISFGVEVEAMIEKGNKIKLSASNLENGFNVSAADSLQYLYDTNAADNTNYSTEAGNILDFWKRTPGASFSEMVNSLDVKDENGKLVNEELKDDFTRMISGDKNVAQIFGLIQSESKLFTDEDGQSILERMAAGEEGFGYEQKGDLIGRLLKMGPDDIGTLMQDEYTGSYLESLFGEYDEGAVILEHLKDGTEAAKETMASFNADVLTKGAAAAQKYGKNTDEIIKNYKEMKSGAQGAYTAMKNMTGAYTSAMDNQYYRSKFRSGDRSSETISKIASMTNLGENAVKEMGDKGIVKQMLDASEKADIEAINTWANTLRPEFEQALQEDVIKAGGFEEFKLQLGDIDLEPGAVNSLNLDEVIAMAAETGNTKLQEAAEMLKSMKLDAHFIMTGSGKDVQGYFEVNTSGLGSGRKSGGGGGGGGGKSAVDELVEKWKRVLSVEDHRIKMTQYQETKYKDDDQLTNYNHMLEYEATLQQEVIDKSKQAIAELEKQRATVKKGSDDWWKLADAIRGYEEKIEEAINRTEEMKRIMHENERQILKNRTDLEDMVVQEIENRIQRQRDMLDGEVSMQDIILGAIRQRYQDEWDLQKKGIEKERQALEESKSLMDEKLNYRKNAEDKAQKYEELAELRRQYSLISMDPTRTRDAAKLREDIGNIERELAWTSAEEEVAAQQAALDDEIRAKDDQITYGDEWMNDYLEDANNFADEVRTVMTSSQEEILQWLMDNVQEYANSLDAAQEQTVQSWNDTYKKWKEIIDTYWEDVDDILSDKTKFLNFMAEGLDYITASMTEQKAMMMDWADTFKKNVQGLLDDKSYSHDDNGDHGEYSGSNQGSGGPGGGGGSSTDQPKKLSDLVDLNTKTKKPEEIFAKDEAVWYAAWNGKPIYEGQKTTFAAAQGTLNVKKESIINASMKEQGLSKEEAEAYATKMIKQFGSIKRYWTGGEADYEGLAIVDGSKSKPEAVLNPKQTKDYKWMMDNVPEYIKKQAMKEQEEYAAKKKSIAEIRARVNNGAQFAVQLSDEDKALLRSLNGNMTDEERSNVSRQVNANIRARIAEQNKTLAEEIKQLETSIMVPLSEFTTSFTSADRDVIKKYMAASAYTMLTPTMSNIDSETMYSTSAVRSIGNVTITINQADLSTDERIEDVAQKIGDAFVRQLSRTGMQVTDFQM